MSAPRLLGITLSAGKQLAERLAAAGVGGLRDLDALDPRRIEAITQRNYPFGALSPPLLLWTLDFTLYLDPGLDCAVVGIRP